MFSVRSAVGTGLVPMEMLAELSAGSVSTTPTAETDIVTVTGACLGS